MGNAPTITESKTLKTFSDLALKLSSASTNTVTVRYATVNGSALAGSDYTAKSGTLTFKPGQTSMVVDIVFLPGKNEKTENFFLKLSSPSGATIGTCQGTAIILDSK